MNRPKRTSSEVLSLVREVSLSLAKGETVKTTAARLGVPYNTMTGMLKRHRQRYRQGSIFQMVAEFVREDELGRSNVMAINNFDVLKEMTKRDLNIRLAPLDNITKMHKTKKGAKVTIGVEYSVMEQISDNKAVGGLIIADKEQFDRIKREMEVGEKLGTDH